MIINIIINIFMAIILIIHISMTSFNSILSFSLVIAETEHNHDIRHNQNNDSGITCTCHHHCTNDSLHDSAWSKHSQKMRPDWVRNADSTLVKWWNQTLGGWQCLGSSETTKFSFKLSFNLTFEFPFKIESWETINDDRSQYIAMKKIDWVSITANHFGRPQRYIVQKTAWMKEALMRS